MCVFILQPNNQLQNNVLLPETQMLFCWVKSDRDCVAVRTRLEMQIRLALIILTLKRDPH